MSTPTIYDNGYSSITQTEIDALTRDELLDIATDGGARQLVRCTLSAGECYASADDAGHIVAVSVDSLRPE